MQVFRRTNLIGDAVNHTDFIAHLARAIVDGSSDPFLVVRDTDGERLELVASDGRIMLCHAKNANRCRVTYGPTYVDGVKPFTGITGQCEAKDACFIDASFAMQAVNAFFQGGRMSEYVDFRQGIPDPAIIEFPDRMTDANRIERNLVECTVDIPETLRSDLEAVCEFLDDIANDPDENIDFDDAIQIGAVCGGRIDARTDTFLFTYHLPNGDTWQFEIVRTNLEGLGDGSIKRLNVLASVPE